MGGDGSGGSGEPNELADDADSGTSTGGQPTGIGAGGEFGAVAFELLAPTKTSDRICRQLRQCDPASEYETKRASWSTDRECGLLTVCGLGEWDVVAATSTSDRKCEPIRGDFCSRGEEFRQAVNNVTSDLEWVCQPTNGTAYTSLEARMDSASIGGFVAAFLAVLLLFLSLSYFTSTHGEGSFIVESADHPESCLSTEASSTADTTFWYTSEKALEMFPLLGELRAANAVKAAAATTKRRRTRRRRGSTSSGSGSSSSGGGSSSSSESSSSDDDNDEVDRAAAAVLSRLERGASLHGHTVPHPSGGLSAPLSPPASHPPPGKVAAGEAAVALPTPADLEASARMKEVVAERLATIRSQLAELDGSSSDPPPVQPVFSPVSVSLGDITTEEDTRL
jgi:hypothetical protein